MARTRACLSMFVAAAAMLLLVAPVSTQQGPRARGSRTTVNGRQAASAEVLVKYRAGTRDDDRRQLNQQLDTDEDHAVGGAGVRRLHSRFYDADALVNFLRLDPRVEYAEPNYVVSAVAAPNDPQFGNLWGLQNLAQTIACAGSCYGGATGIAGADIHATAAWGVSTGSTANVVGVVDTGVDYTHPDLSANVWSSPASFKVTIAGKTITCAAGTHGFRSINLGAMSCDPMDDNNHGSHVSGTIGGRGNNALGVAGINWTASIMGLKFLSSSGSGYTSDAINVMDFAIKAKAFFGSGANVRVLSNSWGGTGFSQAMLDEINLANSSDMLFVAAAGNNGTNNDTTAFYPANFAAPNVVAVAATTNQDVRASFSNYGPTTVHLGAPGQDILSTTLKNTYSYFSGTSMATPHVSGAAALVLSACSLSTAALKSTLLANVDPTLAGLVASGGRLNVDKAIRACSNAMPTPDFSIAATPASQSVVQGAGTSYGVSVTALNAWAGSVALTASGLPTGAAAGFSPASLVSGGSTMTVTTAANTPTGTYTITVTGKGPGNVPTHTTTVKLVVTAAPNFTLSVSPSSRSIRRGQSTTYTVSIAKVGGFAGSVTFSVSGLGAGATGKFNSNPASGSSSTLTITTTSSATQGTFPLTITGVGGALTRTAAASLTVNR
jgi:subtilisin family serine protease